MLRFSKILGSYQCRRNFQPDPKLGSRLFFPANAPSSLALAGIGQIFYEDA